jgi:hypothetical protein
MNLALNWANVRQWSQVQQWGGNAKGMLTRNKNVRKLISWDLALGRKLNIKANNFKLTIICMLAFVIQHKNTCSIKRIRGSR